MRCDIARACGLATAGLASAVAAVILRRRVRDRAAQRARIWTRYLHTAVRAADAAEVKTALVYGADANRTLIDARDRVERTPLHVAASTLSPDVIELLLRAGANVHTTVTDTQDTPETPLMTVVQHAGPDVDWGNDCETCIILLVRAGADVNVGRMAYHAADSTYECLAVLLDAGLRVDTVDQDGMTPLLYALAHPKSDTFRVVQLLRRHGVAWPTAWPEVLTPFDLLRCAYTIVNHFDTVISDALGMDPHLRDELLQNMNVIAAALEHTHPKNDRAWRLVCPAWLRDVYQLGERAGIDGDCNPPNLDDDEREEVETEFAGLLARHHKTPADVLRALGVMVHTSDANLVETLTQSILPKLAVNHMARSAAQKANSAWACEDWLAQHLHACASDAVRAVRRRHAATTGGCCTRCGGPAWFTEWAMDVDAPAYGADLPESLEDVWTALGAVLHAAAAPRCPPPAPCGVM